MSLLLQLLAGDAEGEGRPGPTSPFWYLDDPWMATPAGVTVSNDMTMKLSVVFAAFRKISTTLATLPLHVFRELPGGGRERAWDHPLERTLRRPNRWQTKSQWVQVGEGHLMLRGNAYYRVLDGGDGGFAGEMWPLHPDRVRVLDQLGDGSLVYGYRRKMGEEIALRQDQVLHIAGPSDDGITGLSPLKLMRNAVGLALAAESYGSRLFAQGASPSLVLKHPGILDPDAALRLAGQVSNRTSGANAHLPLVLEDGLTIEKLGLTNEEAQYLGLRDFQVGDLLRFLDTPGVLVGYADKTATYASAEQFFLSFVTHCIRPIAVAWEEKLTAELLVEEDHYVKFNLGALMRGDAASRAAYYEKALKNRWMIPNEVRELEEMNPVPWGNEPLPIQGATFGPGEGEPPPSDPPPPPPPAEDDDEPKPRRPVPRRKRK